VFFLLFSLLGFLLMFLLFSLLGLEASWRLLHHCFFFFFFFEETMFIKLENLRFSVMTIAVLCFSVNCN
jgi:hypothetical protein